ncbi:translation initiation factor IF-2-like [Choloepus didactylus]|uniref:translation initiation factor IF-2-like n=1 Tax=Choloepus didactylus TaxID=27675 RepID=UPI00189D3AA9|nr:translation initiation factor IF-2-like [Choloepus didactylus]
MPTRPPAPRATAERAGPARGGSRRERVPAAPAAAPAPAPSLPVVPQAPRPPPPLWATVGAAAARIPHRTDGARKAGRSPNSDAPSRSLPRTRCAFPPAASSRRELEDGAAPAANPAAEQKAATAEPSPPSARTRPHLSLPQQLSRSSRLRTWRAAAAQRLARGSSGRYPSSARSGRSSPNPGLSLASLQPPHSNPHSGPLPDAVVIAAAARHFRDRQGRSCEPEGCCEPRPPQNSGLRGTMGLREGVQ